jgi:hypothetical protein
MVEVEVKKKKGEYAMRPKLVVVPGRPSARNLPTGTPIVREYVESHHTGSPDAHLNGHTARALNAIVIAKSHESSLRAIRKIGRGMKN